MTRTLALLAALGLTAGCAVKTQQTTYVDPDAYGAVEGTGIESRDVRTVVQEMSRGLLSASVISDFEGTPRIAVLPVKNRSRFLIDQDIFTTQITDMLVQNAAGKLAVLNREIVDQIMAERELKRSGEADAHSLTAVAGADFFLTGEVHSLSASDGQSQSDYVVIRFQLTDAETGIVGWSNSFEMKKEGSWGVMYQ
jgi:PBP1b-binding outer membrane lipoprotein LpoB